VVKCQKISVEYRVIFLILQQARWAASWVSAGHMRPVGRMLCTPDVNVEIDLLWITLSSATKINKNYVTYCFMKQWVFFDYRTELIRAVLHILLVKLNNYLQSFHSYQRYADAVVDTIFDDFADADTDAPWETQISLLQSSYFLATTVLQNSSCICSFFHMPHC